MFLNATVGTASGFCNETRDIWQLVGNILRIVTIILIVCVIIFGIIDFGKAVVASKDEEIKKAAKSVVYRIIAVIVIFFIPTLVGAVFKMIGFFNDNVAADYDICAECIKSPNSGCKK
jgi:Na+/proline symporter